jgi:flagellar motor protein MotB
MSKAFPLWILVVASVSHPAAAADVEELPIGETAERHLPADEPFLQWVQDPSRIAVNLGDTFASRDKVEDELETIKLTGLVPPIHFASGVAEIPDATISALSEILERMQHRRNVRLHLVGHADSQPLSPALAKIYGDNAGLSRERAGEVAEFLQTKLVLPPEAVSYDWAGDTDPVATNATPEGRAQNRRVEVEVWYDEARSRVVQEQVLVEQDVRRVKVCRVQTVCKLRYTDGHEKRARIQNLVAPLHYSDQSIDVDEEFIGRVRQALLDLGDKRNVIVRFVGYTDDSPLSGRMERIYGTPIGLSKARARRVALAVQDALDLPTARIESDGRGALRPLASNETDRGRTLNRRVEVEFWYDDPLQQLPDEPQLCPDAPGAELVTKVYEPAWGRIEPIEFSAGDPVVPAGLAQTLERAMGDIADRRNVRLRFTGYTRNETLDRRTALVYGDDIGLSASRARRAMETVAGEMQLSPSQSEFAGHGYVYADDVVNAGFVQGDTSYVKVEVVYDELAVLDDYEGVEITRLTRELSPQNPLGLNVLRITVDGEPIDDPQKSSADIQRCTDVALEEADILFGFDNLRSAPRLGISAIPVPASADEAVGPPDSGSDGAVERPKVRFTMYANYYYFIDRAEVRLFAAGQSVHSEPLAVIAIGADGTAEWQPPEDPEEGVAFVLRAYGRDGNFDETRPQPLLLADDREDEGETEPYDNDPAAADMLAAAWGMNELARQNIGLGSGTVTVQGSGIPADHEVWVAGHRVPVDESGNFVSEEVLPTGMHTVEVAVLDETGSGELYLRDLEFEQGDWFYVGMADVTLSAGDTTGPMSLLAGQDSPYPLDSTADGRFAFFVDGKFGEHWRLTASADTREGALDEIFSNFMAKSPDALFRRIDPDYYYPTFGDDGTVLEMAPTSGKFFLRLSEQDNFGQWGNFKVAYLQNELAQVDRGLYGANLHLQSDATTEFGENRYAIDAFAAEPGTVPSREEFRGTGGSLYFLRRPDILPGSERVRVEIRDKASGLVTGVLNLAPVVDYDIDYLQGRIMLSEPLASTADDNLLVRSGALSGDEAYLVVRYEFTPGFEELDAMSTGGQAHYWIGDSVRVGLTSSTNSVDDEDSRLDAADVTLRLDAETWLKLQAAKSEGTVSTSQYSNDGGFQFNGEDPAVFAGASATAHRADASIGLDDLPMLDDGRMTFYLQDVEAGYSAPGLATLTEVRNTGGTLHLPILERFAIDAKVDHGDQAQVLRTAAEEVNVSYELSSAWELSAGYRREERTNLSPVPSPALDFGERRDAVLQLGYDADDDWSAHVFVQETLATSGSLPENGRIGMGTSYRVSERLAVEAEVSDGDLGAGGRLGTSYRHSERTGLYLNYVLENERTGTGLLPGTGRGGNLVAGVKSRFSDSASIYQEERYQHGASTGLTHATGISFAPTEHLHFGITTDIGTLRHAQTGAETERKAAGIDAGYGSEALQVSSGIEYRDDDAENPDLLRSERVTWLFRNSLKYQLSPSGRLLGKLNHSTSDSSLGTFYDGGFTEAVLGYAWRPIRNDRLTALAKYTYFYNVPSTDQVAVNGTAVEFIQKSHIAAVDVTWKLTQAVSIGGKYAYRMSQVSLERENPEFFENDASLYILRADWRFREHWDLLAEGRMLAMPDLGERKTGALVAISRQLGDHLKLGLGYNLSEFSDDLTELDFNHQGLFLNLAGAL